MFLETEEKIKALCFNYNIVYIIPILLRFARRFVVFQAHC